MVSTLRQRDRGGCLLVELANKVAGVVGASATQASTVHVVGEVWYVFPRVPGFRQAMKGSDTGTGIATLIKAAAVAVTACGDAMV
jgi:hypothetical protein